MSISLIQYIKNVRTVRNKTDSILWTFKNVLIVDVVLKMTEYYMINTFLRHTFLRQFEKYIFKTTLINAFQPL